MSGDSVNNMMTSVGAMRLYEDRRINARNIIYLLGSMINESISIRTSKRLMQLYPSIKIMTFRGYAHAELAIYHPQEWVKVVKGIIER